MNHLSDFFSREILGMDWLSRLTASVLEALGLDLQTRLGAGIHFFFYDTCKILILLGVLIFTISYLQSYFPPERTRAILGRFHGLGASVMAALLGTVTPFCSCSSIPLFIGFTGAGLPLSTTFSFLISSPMVDLGSLVLLMSIFGWKIAAAYVLFGLVVAIAGGTLIGALRQEDQVEDFVRRVPVIHSAGKALTPRDRAAYGWGQVKFTGKKVLPYVLAGVGIGAVIHNWIPVEWVETLLGRRNPFSVLLAVACGIPMYADIFGTVPIAQALLAKGAQLGVVLSFMMAVTTLSLPSLILLRKAVKPKLLVIFVTICTVGIILAGYVFNLISQLLL